MIRKEFPNLFKGLAKQYGARKAIQILQAVPSIAEDSRYGLIASFNWDFTPQGNQFWVRVWLGGRKV